MFTRILILILLTAMAACAPNPIPDPIPTQGIAANTEEVSPDIMVTPSPAAEGGIQKKFIQIVQNDLATRLNVDVEEINVLLIESIEWPNAALGCPSPGKVYPQGRVPGFRIRLEVDDNEYFYHTDRKGQFVLCPENNVDLPDYPSVPITPGEVDGGES
ncbi:MAG TPA: hypothetical protein VFQ13_25060 [Anaerolineales bacterium]|nr:hypothetical protein [Anaerolineales bacterium]